jgi:signal peptidase II
MIAKKHRTIKWLIWGAIFLMVIADRVTKYFFIQRDTFLQKDYLNEFIAFDIKIPYVVIIFVSAIIVILLVKEIYTAFEKEKYIMGYLIAGVLVGGLSNLIDRIIYGGVIDYIDIIPYFPVFNLADVLITLSVVGIFFQITNKTHIPHGD